MLIPFVFAAITETSNPPRLSEVLQQVSADRMYAIVERLAQFRTRNTNTEGCREAAEWVASELRQIPGLQVELMEYTIEASRRIPETKQVVQVVATLPGETDERIIVGGHLDSLNLAGPPDEVVAPGANDDATGVAASMELARVLAGKKWRNTFVFVAFTGEEQGLLGARALAQRAVDEGWTVRAMLNNDTIGGSENDLGQSDKKHVRVFSEESADHQSRELARYVDWLARENMKDFGVKLVLRRDRFGRGGDHTPFAEAGFNAIRFIEVYEEFGRQHTANDTIEFVDAEYMANVTRVNLLAMTALGNAAPQPERVRIDRRQGHDTRVTWTAVDGVEYVVYWRDTASASWQGHKVVGAVDEAVVELINKDDNIFAVGAIGGIPVEAQ